jgi:uncharacterized membrane protein YphA (DoxX/SURF4 family)
MLDRVGGGFKEYVPFALRLGLATIFVVVGAKALYHGLGSSPSLGRLLELVVSLLGGLFVLIGFLTRWAAFAILVLVLVEIFDGYPGFRAVTDRGEQIWLACAVMSFAVFGLGGGKWSVDLANKRKKEEG